MSAIRKVSDVWNGVDHKRPKELGIIEWKQSYQGVYTALSSIDLILVTTPDEFKSLEIPVRNNGRKSLNNRKVIVSRNGILSKPTRIQGLLTGNSSLLTRDEVSKINEKKSRDQKNNNPKGTNINSDSESKAVDDLDKLIALDNELERRHLYEHRVADIAYRIPDSDFWFADQVKSARSTKRGSCAFQCRKNMTVKDMLSILKNDMSLTCIGKNQEDIVEVIWYFHGQDSINMLANFMLKQIFQPYLYLKIKSNSAFTAAYNDRNFRYEVGNSESERKRLLNIKVDIVRKYAKTTLEYLNDDDSQILLKHHRTEHTSFIVTRKACHSIGIIAERLHKDAKSSVDFRVDGVRVQDKAVGNQFRIRSLRGYPYDPDKIDIFQVTDVDKKVVFAIPMRVVIDSIVESQFDESILMKSTIKFDDTWKTTYGKYKYDLNLHSDIKNYVAACKRAASVAKLTDYKFYTNIIERNKTRFQVNNYDDVILSGLQKHFEITNNNDDFVAFAIICDFLINIEKINILSQKLARELKKLGFKSGEKKIRFAPGKDNRKKTQVRHGLKQKL
jgi:hypothetical protein